MGASCIVFLPGGRVGTSWAGRHRPDLTVARNREAGGGGEPGGAGRAVPEVLSERERSERTPVRGSQPGSPLALWLRVTPPLSRGGHRERGRLADGFSPQACSVWTSAINWELRSPLESTSQRGGTAGHWVSPLCPAEGFLSGVAIKFQTP